MGPYWRFLCGTFGKLLCSMDMARGLASGILPWLWNLHEGVSATRHVVLVTCRVLQGFGGIQLDFKSHCKPASHFPKTGDS